MYKFLVAIVLLMGWQSILLAEKIDSYQIDINIEQNGVLSVTETITYNFENSLKHGIFRDIPFLNNINSTRRDIGLHDFYVQMDGEQIEWKESEEYTAESGKVIRIKIGSNTKKISGAHTYTISYSIKSGIFPAQTDKLSDMIRWNIIGTGWKVPIKHIEANFYLPHILSRQDIALSTYTGKAGSIVSKATTQWLNDSHLQLKLAQLSPHEGATVEMIFPKGKLDQPMQNNFLKWILQYWYWSIVIGALYYSIKVYKKYSGFVDRRAIAVQYYPPKRISVLESGFILNKAIKYKNFAAALIELAQCRYIKIIIDESTKKPILQRTEKSDNGLSPDQQFLLRYIFFNWGKRSFLFSKTSRFKAETLRNGFEEIKNDLNHWAEKEGLILANFEELKKRFYWKSIFYFVPMIFLIVIGIIYTRIPSQDLLLSFSLICSVVGLFICCFTQAIPYKLLSMFLIAVSIFLPIEMREDFQLVRHVVIEPFIVIFISILILYITYRNIGGYTQKGASVRKHLLGLKEFIKRVKKDEIERRLEEDPLYLEKLLPYAILFGQTKHWLSFFHLMNIATPYWYHGNIDNLPDLSSDLDTISSIPSSSTSSNNSSSDGWASDGSIGGFSGGGSGGGGGDSW